MRLIGYIRVSQVRGRDGDSFISPKLQRESIASYAKLHRHQIVDWKQDLDQTGSRLERPGLEGALSAIAAGQAEGLIAAKLDRITRSVAHLGKLLERAKTEGWNLVAVDLGLDMATSNGKLVANVLGSVAEWELDRRRVSWDDAQANAVKRGVHVASRTPTGYRRKANGQLEPDPNTAKVVRELFRRRAAGAGWTALAVFITEKGVLTPYGNRTWTPSAVAKVIHNPAYKGEARAGRHVNPDAHEPLVTLAEWEAAQVRFSVPQPRNGDGLLLSGLVRCAGCRYLTKPDKIAGSDGARLGMYRCRRRHAEGTCSSPVSILSRVVDPYIEEMFLSALGPDGPLAIASDGNSEIESAQRQLDDAARELREYNEAVSVADVGAETFRAGIAARATRVDVARAALADAQRRSGQSGLPPTQDLIAVWQELSVAEKRELIAAGIDAIVVWPVGRPAGKAAPVGERVTIYWHGEAPEDIPRRGRRVPLEPWRKVPAASASRSR
jgi:DNA invertase Pin-like site-specific DNA recombinase